MTADVDFGASFGLKSIYYKSRATNLPTTGILRLGNAETITWRNAGNTATITLGVNSSDQLSLTGADFIYGSAGNGPVVTTPDGSKTYRIYVDNNGELTALELT